MVSSSSSSSNESDLGGAITLLLQDHRITNKSVCKQPEHSKQFMLKSVTVCYQAAGNDNRNKTFFRVCEVSSSGVEICNVLVTSLKR